MKSVTRIPLPALDKMIEEGTAFIGSLVSIDEGVLRFSVRDSEIIEEVPIEWMTPKDLAGIETQRIYYVVETFRNEMPAYTLALYDLSGAQVLELVQNI